MIKRKERRNQFPLPERFITLHSIVGIGSLKPEEQAEDYLLIYIESNIFVWNLVGLHDAGDITSDPSIPYILPFLGLIILRIDNDSLEIIKVLLLRLLLFVVMSTHYQRKEQLFRDRFILLGK